MTQTLQGALQQSIRDAFGCANDFNGDLHVLCDFWSVPQAPISGRLIPVAKNYDSSINDATSALNFLLVNYQTAVVGGPSLQLNFVAEDYYVYEYGPLDPSLNLDFVNQSYGSE